MEQNVKNKKDKEKFYVTTPIYYPNAKPHIGTTYTTVAADILARWNKLLRKDVFFLTGTDEHGQKLALAAEKSGMKPKDYVDSLVTEFKNAWKKFNIVFDGFIRTTDKSHEECVKKVIKKLYEKGDLYEAKYKGPYCIHCESYWTEKDLVEGKCPSCNRPVTEFEEDAYFFRLSKYQDALLKFYDENPFFVLPKTRMNEIKARVKEGLKDVSFTRKKFKWGVEFPIDSSYVLWVWPDALTNYVSALGCFESNKFKKYWPADVHLIGKDILWFHAVIWPAMLMSIGVDLPKTIFAHGWWTVEGEKMSKSKGNVIDPLEIAEKYGVDSIRYFLFREAPFGDDGDISIKRIIERHNTELVNKLGNLVLRVTALAEKYGIEQNENKLIEKLKFDEIKEKFDNYELDKALALIFDFIDTCNLYVQENELWKTRDKKKLYELCDSIKAIAILLWPFMPETSEKIARVLGFEIKSIDQIQKPLKLNKIKKSEILFRKIG